MDKDQLLKYARELFDEVGLRSSARLEVIKRLRERFDLGLKEAKDLVDEAYEELCQEAEEEEEDEVEEEEVVEEHPGILEEFLESLEGSYDHEFVHNAGFVINSLRNCLRDYHGTSLEKMDASLVDDYMMDYFPRKVTMDVGLVDRVPDILILFCQFAGEKGYIKDAGPLVRQVESLRKIFVKVAKDPRNFGPAKSFATAMLEAGVDPSDKRQVDAFMVEYNLRLLGQAKPRTFEPPPPINPIPAPTVKPLEPPTPVKPKIARNAPCPCGSRRKYKKCCGKAAT